MSILNFVKEARRNRIIRRHYGETHPKYASVVGGDVDIRVDATDRRARKILLLDTARGRDKANQAFWFYAIASFRPTIRLDVGLNYGECLLSSRTPSDTRGYGFEANTRLRPYIEETLASHPDRERLEVVFAPVAHEAGLSVTLNIDPNWSGASHVTLGADAAGEHAITSTTVTVDGTVPRPSDADRLLFKVDIEGFEPSAIQGMKQTVAAAGSAIGFIEFSPQVLRERGVDVASYWEELTNLFRCFACYDKGDARPIATADWSEAETLLGTSHGDLILTAGLTSEEETRFLDGWRARASVSPSVQKAAS